jgi:hypothetical protein
MTDEEALRMPARRQRIFNRYAVQLVKEQERAMKGRK